MSTISQLWPEGAPGERLVEVNQTDESKLRTAHQSNPVQNRSRERRQ